MLVGPYGRRGLLIGAAMLWPLAAGAAEAQVSTGTPSTTAPLTTVPPTTAPSTTQPSSDAAAAEQSSSTQLGDIIVIGTKLGATNLQRTPVAVSVVDSGLLENQNLNRVQDIANYVPNLTFARSAGNATVYIRGIGSNSTNAGSDPSVTQQVDGVYIARPSAQTSDFFDVDRIEVLRGPQGTLYGRNAVGGTVNIISRTPSSTFGGRFRVGYGAFDEVTAEGYLTGPVSGDALTASLAASFRRNDPYFDNIVPNVSGTGAANRLGTRAQLRFDPTSDFNLTLRADYQRVRDIYDGLDHLLLPVPFPAPLANSLIGSYRDIAVNERLYQNVDQGGVSLEGNLNLGGGFAIKMLSAYRKLKSAINQDNDATEVPVQFLQSTERQRQFSSELNVNYTSDALNAVFGLYYFGDNDFQRNFSQAPASVATPIARSAQLIAAPTVKTDSVAAFGQVNYEFLPGLTAIAGIRYTNETKNIAQNFQRTSLNPPTLGVSAPGFPAIFFATRTDSAWTPKFGLNFQVTPDVFLYASATRGFKSGGYNNAAVTATSSTFSPENLWSYEAGAKTELFDRRLRLNLTGFIYDYTDLQVRQFIGVGQAVISNAASARVEGVELETQLKLASDFQVSGNVAYLHARYRTFTTASVSSAYTTLIPNQVVSGGVATFDASGNQIEGSPDWSGVVAADYTPRFGSGRLSLHADYQFRGRTFFDPSNIPIASQKSYGLANASIGFGLDQGIKVEAYIRNAFDRKYYLVIGGNGIVPGATAGDPRTYGVRLGYSF